MDGGQQIVLIGILGKEITPGIRIGLHLCHPVHLVIGILRPGSFRILRVLHPFQHIGIGVVAVLCYLPQRVRGGNKAVAVSAVRRRRGNGAVSALNGHGGILP